MLSYVRFLQTPPKLTTADVRLLRALNALFGEAFGDPEAYGADPPSDVYLEALLAKDHVIALAVLLGQEVVGGLAPSTTRPRSRTPERGRSPTQRRIPR